MGNAVLSRRNANPAGPGSLRVPDRGIESRYPACVDEAQRLIRAGVAEMAEGGSADLRVSDIVRRAGLSNKAFYRHFRSKDDLLIAILEESMRGLARRFEERLRPERDPVDRVRAWVWSVCERALDPALSAEQRPLVLHQGRLLDTLGEPVSGHVARLIGLLQRAIAEARASGAVSASVDPERDGEAIFHLAMGWTNERVLGRVTPTREEAERLVAFAVRGLGLPEV